MEIIDALGALASQSWAPGDHLDTSSWGVLFSNEGVPSRLLEFRHEFEHVWGSAWDYLDYECAIGIGLGAGGGNLRVIDLCTSPGALRDAVQECKNIGQTGKLPNTHVVTAANVSGMLLHNCRETLRILRGACHVDLAWLAMRLTAVWSTCGSGHGWRRCADTASKRTSSATTPA